MEMILGVEGVSQQRRAAPSVHRVHLQTCLKPIQKSEFLCEFLSAEWSVKFFWLHVYD